MSNDFSKTPIVFMGTSDFSAIILETLLNNKYNIVGVFTQPDKKVGRNQEVHINPVKQFSLKNKLPIFQPEKLDLEAAKQIKKLDPKLILVTAYGKIIPREILEIPEFGCLNVHASLLPKYRGASPIQNALSCGEKETGVTIIRINEDVDAGDIIAKEKIAIDGSDTAETLSPKIAALGAELLLKTIPKWISREITPEKQDPKQATLCQLIDREDGHIFWEEEAQTIYNKYRAFYPWPGIFSFWISDDVPLRIKLNKISLQKINPESKHKAGEVFELGDKIGVQALDGVIVLEEIQEEGKKSISAKDFINGHSNFIGSVLN